MYDPYMVTLRYGKLSNGLHIPLCYALENDEGGSILFQNPNGFAMLAYTLGADINPDLPWDEGGQEEHRKALDWLDATTGERFNVAGTYDEWFDLEDNM